MSDWILDKSTPAFETYMSNGPIGIYKNSTGNHFYYWKECSDRSGLSKIWVVCLGTLVSILAETRMLYSDSHKYHGEALVRYIRHAVFTENLYETEFDFHYKTNPIHWSIHAEANH